MQTCFASFDDVYTRLRKLEQKMSDEIPFLLDKKASITDLEDIKMGINADFSKFCRMEEFTDLHHRVTEALGKYTLVM